MDVGYGSKRLAKGHARRAALLLELRRPGEQGEARAVGVDELASAVGLHANTVREHLMTLVSEGLVERQQGAPVGRGRPATLYVAARQLSEASHGPLASQDMRDRVLSILLASHGRDGAAADSAMRDHGARWGEELWRQAGMVASPDSATSLIVRSLHHMGMEPEFDAATGWIEIGACPLAEAAHDHPDVVCGIHDAMIHGLCAAAGVPRSDVALVPFQGPLMCRVRVRESA